MTINTYSNNTLNSILGSSASRGVSFRGGVTGWEQKETSGPTGSSSGVSSEVSDYLTSVKNFGSKLNDAMASLTGAGGMASIFDSLGATSTDSGAMSVSISDQTKAKEFLQAGGEKKVSVSQVATAQQNRGDALTASATNTMSLGKNSFSIEKGGKTYDLEADINYTDSNRTAQQKVADAINKENIGVKATVEFNENTNESRLVLNSSETGEDGGFSIEDGRGSTLISKMGVEDASREANDAVYSVDGVEMTSASNDVDLGDGLKAKLKDTTEEDATVKAGQNTTGITNAVYDMVNNFNQLREAAVNMNDDRNAKNLQERLDGLSSAYKSTLSDMGISTNSSGYLELDKEKMTAAIENGNAEKAIGSDSSFSRSLTSLSSQAESDPARFLSYKARTQTEGNSASTGDYFADSSGISYSPSQMMQASHWDMVGMLFSAGF